jgi:hypothetical protein
MGELDGWLTLPAAAERFGLKHDRLRRATLEGRLKARKLGEGRAGMWLVRAENVEAYLRETRKGPKPRSQAAEGPEATSADTPMTGYERGREG